MAKKELTYDQISKITSIEGLIDFQNYYEEELAEIAVANSNIDWKRYKGLDKKTQKIVRLLFVKDFFNTINESSQEEHPKRQGQLNNFIEFKFIEVLNVLEDQVVVRELDKSVINSYYIKDKPSFKEGHCIFCLTYLLKNSFTKRGIYKDFIEINQEEMKRTEAIYAEHIYGDSIVEFFINEIVIRRALLKHSETINNLIENYSLDLEDIYEPETLFNFYSHFNQINRYLFFLEEERDIFNLDYYDFLTKEAKLGNFTVEGDLEDFVEIIDQIMLMVSEDLGKDIEALDSIEKARNNIFSIKKIMQENNSITPIDFVVDIEDLFINDKISIVAGVYLGLMAEAMIETGYIDITKVKKQITSKQRKDIIKNVFPSYEEKESNFKELEIFVDLVFSALYGNGYYNDLNNVTVTAKDSLFFVLDKDPSIRIANILRLIFTPKAFSHYFSLSKEKGIDLLNKTFMAMEEEDFTNLEKDKKGREIKEILKILLVIKEDKTKTGGKYILSPLGRVIKRRLLKKQKPAKVLKLENYK